MKEYWLRRNKVGFTPTAKKQTLISVDLDKIKEKSSLDFLLKIKHVSVKAWNYPQAKLLLDGIQEAFKAGHVNYPIIFKKYGSGKAASSCLALIRELKLAAEEGMSLEAYWKTDRKFQTKPKVLVKAKK